MLELEPRYELYVTNSLVNYPLSNLVLVSLFLVQFTALLIIVALNVIWLAYSMMPSLLFDARFFRGYGPSLLKMNSDLDLAMRLALLDLRPYNFE